MRACDGRPIVRGRKILAGQVSKKRMPARRKAAGNHRPLGRDFLPKDVWITGRISGLVSGRESKLTLDRWAFERKQAYMPEPRDKWEAQMEPRSYGFRLGRSRHDVIASLFQTPRGRAKRIWILDADVAGAFDKIDHDHLMGMVGDFAARGMIADWLKAGISRPGGGSQPPWRGLLRVV